MKVIITKNLKGQELDSLLSFIIPYADMFSLERDAYPGEISWIQYQNSWKELKHYYEKNDKERRDDYQKSVDFRQYLRALLDIKTVEEAEEYFDVLYQQEMNNLGSNDYSYYLEIYGCSNYKDCYPITHPDFQTKKISRISVCGVGPYYSHCFFRGDTLINEISSNLQNIFDYHRIVGEHPYMNLLLYTNKSPIFSIYNELQEVNLELNSDQFKKFLCLKIDHTVGVST